MASDESPTKSFSDELRKMPEWKQELLMKRKNLQKTNVSSLETVEQPTGSAAQNGLTTASDGMHLIEWIMGIDNKKNRGSIIYLWKVYCFA